ncbi:hypothetical protein GQ457_16G008780 [Hibiscus cannabinus]
MTLHGAGFLSVSSNGQSLVVSLASPASLSQPLGPPEESECSYCIVGYVDGAMKSDGSAGGIGGVLRNDTRVRLITFSVRIGAGPRILAELLAIKHNIEVFQNSQWNAKSKLILESNCKVAIDWIRDPIKTPVCFSSLITSITNGWTCIRHIPRAGHCEVLV